MMKRFRLERSPQATRDLKAILRFLIKSHRGFGERFDGAKERASKRVLQIEAAMEKLARLPKQGTLLPKLMPGLRRVTKDRAVFYFIIDEEPRIVRVLAVFFGGQDHQSEMLKRLARE